MRALATLFRSFVFFALLLTCAFVGGCRRSEPLVTTERLQTVRVNETLSFDPKIIRCAPGQPVRLRLVNAIAAGLSELPHNFVLLGPDTDVEAFGVAAVNGLAEDDFLPAGFAGFVLAATPLVKPSDYAEIVFRAPTRPGTYSFVCSFPGHCLMGMSGQLVVQ